VPDHRGWGRPPTDCAFKAGETPAAREGRTNEVTPVAAPPSTAPPLPETDESAATGTAAPPPELKPLALTINHQKLSVPNLGLMGLAMGMMGRF